MKHALGSTTRSPVARAARIGLTSESSVRLRSGSGQRKGPPDRPVGWPTVRLVIAPCSVDYEGRLTAHLPLATRLLLVKADGSVLVHSDGGSYKPLNWMSPPARWPRSSPTSPRRQWASPRCGSSSTRSRRTGSACASTRSLHDGGHDLGIDPGLVKDGVEAHLQRLLAEHIHTLGDGWSLVRREYMTAIGPVDILARDARAPRRRRDQAARRHRRRRAADPLPRADEPRPAPLARSPGCSPRRRSSRRPAPSPRTAASAASSSTTTPSGIDDMEHGLF